MNNFNNAEGEKNALFSRLEDLKRSADKGELAVGSFLSPRELYMAESFLSASGAEYFFFGGYTDAERRRVYILPEYMSGDKSIETVFEYGYSSKIRPLLIKGSGFEKLSHRDFMGAVLGLGIERSVIGDIVGVEGNSAVVFCDETIAEFIISEMKSVGRDKISVTSTELPENFRAERVFLPVNDTVASPRLDCVVAALCSLSREKARQAVEGGSTELNYENEERPDREVVAPCIISVRGYGKFRVNSLCEKTKKGRYRLSGEKFV